MKQTTKAILATILILAAGVATTLGQAQQDPWVMQIEAVPTGTDVTDHDGFFDSISTAFPEHPSSNPPLGTEWKGLYSRVWATLVNPDGSTGERVGKGYFGTVITFRGHGYGQWGERGWCIMPTNGSDVWNQIILPGEGNGPPGFAWVHKFGDPVSPYTHNANNLFWDGEVGYVAMDINGPRFDFNFMVYYTLQDKMVHIDDRQLCDGYRIVIKRESEAIQWNIAQGIGNQGIYAGTAP